MSVPFVTAHACELEGMPVDEFVGAMVTA